MSLKRNAINVVEFFGAGVLGLFVGYVAQWIMEKVFLGTNWGMERMPRWIETGRTGSLAFVGLIGAMVLVNAMIIYVLAMNSTLRKMMTQGLSGTLFLLGALLLQRDDAEAWARSGLGQARVREPLRNGVPTAGP